MLWWDCTIFCYKIKFSSALGQTSGHGFDSWDCTFSAVKSEFPENWYVSLKDERSNRHLGKEMVNCENSILLLQI